MAKTIKFNLICDEHSVRTLDDLREHFSIEDVLNYYENGVLQRWLQIRGYTEELEAVNGIQAQDDMSAAKEMIKIFGLEESADDIEKALYVLKYREEKSASVLEYIKQSESIEFAVNSHFEGYNKLIQTICENKDNLPLIKAAVKEINDKYLNIFERDYKMLFISLYESAPLAVFVMLMFDTMRNKFLWDSAEKLPEKLETTSDFINADRKQLHDLLMRFMRDYTYKALREVLGDNLKIFGGETDNYWKDLEPGDKKYMILKIENGDSVRSAGKRDEILEAKDVNGKFPILDGVDYRSNNAYRELFYMEV